MIQKHDLIIIDDDPTTLKLILLMLSNYQLSIKIFTDPLDGLTHIIKYPPKVIFIDYNMPNINGQELIIKMSQNYIFQHSSIYLLTGTHFDENATMKLMTLGFSKIISKPFKEEVLFEVLNDNLGTIKKKNNAA